MRHYSRAEMEQVYDRIVGERVPGAGDQGVYEESAIQNFVIGARREIHESVYRYVHAGTALRSGWGAQTMGSLTAAGIRETNTIAAAALAGARIITCTAVGAVVANEFRGGQACIHWEFSNYRILSNTAAALGAVFNVVLDRPLEQAIDAASIVTLYRNMYADVQVQEGAGTHPLWASTVGIPTRTVANGSFAWILTWGPAVCAGVENMGADSSERGLFFIASGAVSMRSNLGNDGTAPSNQHAGYLLPYTGPGPVGVDQPGALIHLMLQLAP